MTQAQREYLARYLEALLSKQKVNKVVKKKIKSMIRSLDTGKRLKKAQKEYLFTLCRSSKEVAEQRLSTIKKQSLWKRLVNYRIFKQYAIACKEAIDRHTILMTELGTDGQNNEKHSGSDTSERN